MDPEIRAFLKRAEDTLQEQGRRALAALAVAPDPDGDAIARWREQAAEVLGYLDNVERRCQDWDWRIRWSQYCDGLRELVGLWAEVLEQHRHDGLTDPAPDWDDELTKIS